ncbi:DUF5825 family protein [Nonomuraea sp. NPDC002799]
MKMTLRLWRDYDERARRLPGMDLGHRLVDPAQEELARDLYQQGVRRVEVAEPVDARHGLAALALVRELTSYAVVVDWEPGQGIPLEGLGHLAPPRRLDDADRLSAWRRGFSLGRYVYRHGPGFVQVRDWRSGRLRRLTIDDPAYLAAIPALLRGTIVDAVATPMLQALATGGLVAIAGGQAIWLPYRVRRWTFGSEAA